MIEQRTVPSETTVSPGQPELNIGCFDYLDLKYFNVLPQTRTDFFEGEAEVLKGSLIRHGLKGNLIVAKLDTQHLRVYVDEFAQFVGQKVVDDESFKRVRENRKNWHYVIIAGERRTKALESMTKKEREKALRDSGGKVLCLVHENISAKEACFLQVTENTQAPVSPDREAFVYQNLFHAETIASGRPTIKDFAEQVCRTTDKISASLVFSMLPWTIQEAVRTRIIDPKTKRETKKRQFPYSHAVLLARFQERTKYCIKRDCKHQITLGELSADEYMEKRLSDLDQELIDHMAHIIKNKMNLTSAETYLKHELVKVDGSQQAFEFTLDLIPDRIAKQAQTIRTLSSELTAALQTSKVYLQQLEWLYGQAQLNVEIVSPFLNLQNLEGFRVIVEMLDLLRPHLVKLVRLEEEKQAAQELSEQSGPIIEKTLYLVDRLQGSLIEVTDQPTLVQVG